MSEMLALTPITRPIPHHLRPEVKKLLLDDQVPAFLKMALSRWLTKSVAMLGDQS